MAVFVPDGTSSKLLDMDAQGNPFGFIEIGETGTVHFTCLVLDVNGVSYYLWPAASGKLKYGTTAPTISTQTSAGTYISP